MKQREIKFRAWNKQTYKMSDWSEVKKLYNWNIFDQVAVHLMQFTGLKDKNATEIYEGDIVNDTSVSHIKREVIFHKGTFCFKVAPNSYHIFNEKEVEVIGNIYENKDLLT